MAGTFIDVVVDAKLAKDPELASKLEEVCPVELVAHGLPHRVLRDHGKQSP